MPDQKYKLWVPGLPAALTLSGSEQIAIVQGSTTAKMTISDLAAYIGGGGSTPSLSDVLNVGNDTGGSSITSVDSAGYISLNGDGDDNGLYYNGSSGNSGHALANDSGIELSFGNGSTASEIIVHSDGIGIFSAAITPGLPIMVDASGNITSVNVAADGITAAPGGGQSSATVLFAIHNMVDIVASPNDSVKMDVSTVGPREVTNSSANDMALFPAVGERFQNGSTLMAINAPLTIAAGNSIKLVCYSSGVWRF